jgi:hypothetical protein
MGVRAHNPLEIAARFPQVLGRGFEVHYEGAAPTAPTALIISSMRKQIHPHRTRAQFLYSDHLVEKLRFQMTVDTGSDSTD